MSERELRRRVLPNRRATSSSRRAPKPSPSPSPLRRRVRPPTLKRSNSEPSLLTDGVEAQANEEDGGGVLYRPQTCTDIFHSPENLVGWCNNELFNRDAKVVVSVTVEGSPGPIRTMVRLGSNVEETIKLVIDKYNEEGRTPRLSKEDAASALQLHSSPFSLQSLSRSDLIGDVGSRSFYLHKCGCNSNSFRIDNESVASSNQSNAAKSLFRSRFIDRKFRRFVRNFRKIMGCVCLPCT